jgi:hypothetical protein
MRKLPAIPAAAILLGAMAALMIGAARQDSATVDETTVLGAGYTYLKGHRYKMQPEHPPFSQMLPAVPLLFMDVKFSDNARALLEGRAGYPWTRPWFGMIRPWQELFPQGRDNWYFWALPESQLFGQIFVYDGTNDGERMMFRGRLVQILLALGVGVIIFLWVRRATANEPAALAALATWTFNPNALAHGHLITTDIGVTFAMCAAVFLFARLLQSPTPKAAAFCGAATGVALVMKFTAVILAPIFAVLAAVWWKNLRATGANFWKLAAILIGSAWAVVLLVYFPRWSPAPPLPDAQAVALGVPGWFRSLRPMLIPPDFFKGLALTLGHSRTGHDAYLMGNWSHSGWWYYYPLAFLFKSPLAFVIFTLIAAGLCFKRIKSAGPLEIAPWVAAMVFVVLAMTSKVNIGVRHILPVVPLVCVGIGCAVPRLNRWFVGALLAWQFLVTLLAHPLYLQFFSEAVGGAKNGYKYLLDSNYDWGQDAKRLKKFLDEHGIQHIYLDYFGTQFSIEYLKIPNTRVNAEQARQLRDGWLVVSASQLMRPEWAWLRESRQPVARVAHTLFVYQLP